jgi:glycerol-3-phosphate dehydrogenase (NAD(P)+)
VNTGEIAILGAGSWGTSLAVLLSAMDRRVHLWGRDPERMNSLRNKRENDAFLPGVRLPPEVSITSNLNDIRAAELVLFVVPSRALRQVAVDAARGGLAPGAILLSCTKGIEQGSGARMSEVIGQSCPGHPVAVLSGPSHAEEVARRMPTAIVLGANDADVCAALQQTFSNDSLRAYTSDDVAGIELGGALKNIFAIAAGLSDGLGFGDNSKAALVTRALVELIRLGVALGGRAATFQGLSGMGDLMVTCFSRHSRNRSVGERLGRGETLEQICDSMTMVAEGIPTARSAMECARARNIDAPIIEQVYEVLYEKKPAAKALQELMSRDLRAEK